MPILIPLALAIIVFLAGNALRIVRFVRLPLPLRWELYPIPKGPRERQQYGGSYFEESEWWEHPQPKDQVSQLSFVLREVASAEVGAGQLPRIVAVVVAASLGTVPLCDSRAGRDCSVCWLNPHGCAPLESLAMGWLAPSGWPAASGFWHCGCGIPGCVVSPAAAICLTLLCWPLYLPLAYWPFQLSPMEPT